MSSSRRARITEEQAAQKYGPNTLYTLAVTGKATPAWRADGRSYNAKKLDRAVKKAAK
ncbi:hypothetical protein ABZ897_60425 [Nonomuraea sp. NPDC046802]|uniref:hypothetical protein n=1 Tax=Nonomuraea sp. NPDC046802 TaxID=3154919 RepID=UPI0033F0EEB2